jgi:hypothetical protein
VVWGEGFPAVTPFRLGFGLEEVLAVEAAQPGPAVAGEAIEVGDVGSAPGQQRRVVTGGVFAAQLSTIATKGVDPGGPGVDAPGLGVPGDRP